MEAEPEAAGTGALTRLGRGSRRAGSERFYCARSRLHRWSASLTGPTRVYGGHMSPPPLPWGAVAAASHGGSCALDQTPRNQMGDLQPAITSPPGGRPLGLGGC